MFARRIATAFAACAVLVLGCSSASAARQATSGGWDEAPQLQVDVTDDEYPTLAIALDGLDLEGYPGRATIDVPPGFELYPDRPIDSIVGNALIYAGDSAFGGITATLLQGQIVAEPLDSDAEASAQACSPGKHLAIWKIRLSLLGQPLDTPIYISRQGESRLKLDFCTPALAPSGTLIPIQSLRLELPELAAPHAKGEYIWSAVVTPVAPDRHTLLPQKAYELRALVPVPHVLTLRGSYAPRSHLAVLHGRLMAAGKPRPGIRVYFRSLLRQVTPHGTVYRDSIAGSTRTTASGTFTFRKRIKSSTGFLAYVATSASACTGPATAPGGCESTTTAPTRSEPVTISIPHP